MDSRAKKILLNTYWSASGWRPESDRRVSEADFAYAKAAGMMFDPIESSHEELVNRLIGEVARCDRTNVANAFLASLSSRRLDWRSALGSYALFRHMCLHTPATGERRCSHCGMYLTKDLVDLNILNFERFKWGGVRHSHVEYALLDIELFNRQEVPKPTEEDLGIFRELIHSCRSVSEEVTASVLHKHLPCSLKGNKAEKDVLIAILGITGILGTAEHPGFTEGFIPASSRALPNRRFVDMSYPACWWNGKDGVDETALTHFFGHIQ